MESSSASSSVPAACVGAVLVAIFAGEGRALAPPALRAPAAPAVARAVSEAHREAARQPRPALRPREAIAKKVHVDTGNDEMEKNAWVYVPAAFDATKRALRVIVVFHGFKNCLDSYVSPGGKPCRAGEEQRTGYDVAGQVTRSGTGAIVVVPQLAFDTKSAEPGKLGKPGGLRRFLTELVEQTLAGDIGPHAYQDIERVMLVASSGGYEGLLPALGAGEVERVRDVYLLDAFYVDTSALNRFLRDRPEDFRPDAEDQRHFGLVYCKKSGTAAKSAEFGASLVDFMRRRGEGAFVAFDPASRAPSLDDLRVPAFVYRSSLEHDKVVAEYLWQVLVASGI